MSDAQIIEEITRLIRVRENRNAGSEIEPDIPIPARHPFRRMKVGDSVLCQPPTKAPQDAAAKYKQRHPGWDYRSRTLPNGTLRIWRTA